MLATKLKDLRTSKKMTQNELAQMLGVTQQAVARWENGRSEPDATTLNWLATFFDVSVDYLLGNKNESVRPLSREQKNLLTDFESLTRDGQNMILGILNSLKVTHAAGN